MGGCAVRGAAQVSGHDSARPLSGGIHRGGKHGRTRHWVRAVSQLRSWHMCRPLAPPAAASPSAAPPPSSSPPSPSTLRASVVSAPSMKAYSSDTVPSTCAADMQAARWARLRGRGAARRGGELPGLPGRAGSPAARAAQAACLTHGGCAPSHLVLQVLGKHIDPLGRPRAQSLLQGLGADAQPADVAGAGQRRDLRSNGPAARQGEGGRGRCGGRAPHVAPHACGRSQGAQQARIRPCWCCHPSSLVLLDLLLKLGQRRVVPAAVGQLRAVGLQEALGVWRTRQRKPDRSGVASLCFWRPLPQPLACPAPPACSRCAGLRPPGACHHACPPHRSPAHLEGRLQLRGPEEVEAQELLPEVLTPGLVGKQDGRHLRRAGGGGRGPGNSEVGGTRECRCGCTS